MTDYLTKDVLSVIIVLCKTEMMKGGDVILKKKTVIRISTLRRDADDGLIDAISEILKTVDDGLAAEDSARDDELVREALGFLGSEDIFDDDLEEIITEGYIEIGENGCVEISYEESEIGGLEGSRVRLVFNADSPSLVSMIREGAVSTMLSFEEGKRHRSTYNTPYMPFDLVLNTSRVDNRILEEGKLTLCYVMEIRGLSVSRCRLDITVSKPT